jgi:hypothetical protein
MKFLIMFAILFGLTGCSTAALSIAIPVLTYLASVNNLGAESLNFLGNQKNSCPLNTPLPKINFVKLPEN